MRPHLPLLNSHRHGHSALPGLAGQINWRTGLAIYLLIGLLGASYWLVHHTETS